MAGRPFSAGLGWGKEEIEGFQAKVRTSLKDGSRHTYLPFRVIYAQKPKEKFQAKVIVSLVSPEDN